MKKLYNILMAAAIALGTLTACEDVPMPYNNPLDQPEEENNSIEPVGNGTADSPYNVAAAINYVNNLGSDVESSDYIYITGVVTSVTEAYGTQYGNGTFVISDTDEGTNKFTFYRGLYLGNKKYSNTSDDNIKEGDVVVIYGKVINFRGNTPETVQGSAWLYSLNGKTGGTGGNTPSSSATAKGSGTQADPYNVAGVLNFINGLGADVTSSSEVYIKGKVKEVSEQFGTQYGNATFTMVDEGYDAIFTAYRVLYLGNAKYTSGTTIKEGDEVIVCGKVVNFRGNTPETAQNTGYLYSLNGQTGSTSGGGETPSAETAKGSGTQADPYNVKAIHDIAAKLSSGETSTDDYYFQGKISSVKYTFSADYGTATFYISEDGKENSTQFYIYSALYLGNQNWVNGKTQIKVGDDVIICGKLTNYNGTLETASKKSYIYSLNGKTTDDGSGSGTGTGGETSGNMLTVQMADLGLANGTDMNTQTLSDGTTLTFSGEENTNAPKYYTSGSAARVYAKNSITIKSAGKNITKVVLNCVATYVGNEQIFGEADGKKVSVKREDPTVTFSDFSSQTLKIVNDYTEAKAGTQLRIVSVEITYAN